MVEDEKICLLCGLSCAGQPRTRNERGQYAHQACAKAKQGAVKASTAPARPGSVAVLGENDDEMMGALLADIPAEAPAHAPSVSDLAGFRQGCPGCGVALASDTVVCTGCGFNLKKGKGLKTKVSKAKDPRQSILETSAVAAGTTYFVGACLGAGLGGAIGAAVWAGIISAVQFQVSIVAIAVAALCGIGAAYGSKGNVSVATGAIATVCAVGAILAGKWFGGSALGDSAMETVLRDFRIEWRHLDHEGRGLYAQRDRARDLIVVRLEAGNAGGIEDFQYEWALESEDYPERYPAHIVTEVDAWWYGMDETEQDTYIDALPDLLVTEFESRREEIREMGFMSTIGLKDAVYFAVAVVVAFGLGSNENTAPFIS